MTDEPAFPFEYETGDGARITHNGMSLRDYFAAKAITASANAFGPSTPAFMIAVRSYEIADAMLAARATKTESRS